MFKIMFFVLRKIRNIIIIIILIEIFYGSSADIDYKKYVIRSLRMLLFLASGWLLNRDVIRFFSGITFSLYCPSFTVFFCYTSIQLLLRSQSIFVRSVFHSFVLVSVLN